MSNQFPGPKKGKGKSLWENLNLVSLLGNLKRDNTKFKGYAENPEFFDQAGKEGVKFRNSPFNRAFALGNTVFMNQKQVDRVADYEHGIDTSYSNSCDDNCDSRLEYRAGNVSDDDGSEYPVHFSDNDRDGKLSAGDQFMVYGTGNSANGPAADNWRLDIQFDASGDIIGSAKLL